MSQEYTYDVSDYDNFNNYSDYEDSEDYSDNLNSDNSENSDDSVSNDDGLNIISILSFISTWFIRIGLVVAFIVFIYYIFTGRFGTAFLYILGLVVAYWFGYGLMFLLDKFVAMDE